MDYKAFKNELQNYYKYLKNVDKIKEEINQIWYDMSGVKAIRYDKQLITHNPELSNMIKHEYMSRIEEKEIELDHVLSSIKYIELKLSKMNPEDKQVCIDIISKGISSEKVANEKGYSKSGMWKRIKRELERVL